MNMCVCVLSSNILENNKKIIFSLYLLVGFLKNHEKRKKINKKFFFLQKYGKFIIFLMCIVVVVVANLLYARGFIRFFP